MKTETVKGETYVAIEQVNSPARGLLTLYLVGRLQRAEIVDAIDNAQEDPAVRAFGLHLCHLHFGAKGSFDGAETQVWADTIKHFLREGFWCSLNMRFGLIPLIMKTGLCRQARFIPIVDVAIPQAQSLGYNATLKIDDTSNPGVWTTSLTGLLQNRQQVLMTPWIDLVPTVPVDYSRKQA